MSVPQQEPTPPEHLPVQQQEPTPPELLPVQQQEPTPPEHLPVQQQEPTPPEHLPVQQKEPTPPEHLPVQQQEPTPPEHLPVQQQERTSQTTTTENDNVGPSSSLVIEPGAISPVTQYIDQPMDDVRTSYIGIPQGLLCKLESIMTKDDRMLLASELDENVNSDLRTLLISWEAEYGNVDWLMCLAIHFQNAGRQEIAELIKGFI